MKIVFTGDVSISGSFLNSVEMERQILDQKIIDIFLDSDIVHINLENPITDKRFVDKKGSVLRAPPNIIKYFYKYNVNVCNLANNHIMDCGENGLLDTISLLRSNNIDYYGIGPYKKYILVKEEDLTIALISSCSKDGPVFNKTNVAPYYLNLTEIKEIVGEIKNKYNIDFIIFNYHGGTEFNIVPEPERRIFFKNLLDIGVDLVVGHHAHVPQGVEYVNDSIIVYGLGNFCFDTNYQRSHYYTSESYFVQLIISKKFIKLNKYFYYLNLENGKVIMDTNNSELKMIIEKSEDILTERESYIKAWEEDCFRVYLKPLVKIFSIKRINNSKNNSIIKLIIFLLAVQLTRDLRNKYRRVVVIGAMMYVLKRFI